MNKVLNNIKEVIDTPIEKAHLMSAVKNFYITKTLPMKILQMVRVRYEYEEIQLKYNYSFEIMPEDITKIVGQFHRLSTTIIAQELGDDSQYLDKIMDKAWDIVCEDRANDVSAGNTNDKIKELLASMQTDAGE